MGRIFRTLTFTLLTAVSYSRMPARAQALTTIRDTVKNADNTNFYGRVLISWQGFTAASGEYVAPHNATLTVTNGYLSVALVPTTNASEGAYYTVQYAANNGTTLWTDYWNVPPSSTPLTIGQVKISNPLPPGGGDSDGGSVSLPIHESDVINLVSDLAARPQRSTSAVNNRVAIFDGNGALATVSGSSADCVHADGTAGSCGTTNVSVAAVFVDHETPSGSIDGSNPIFELSQAPSPGLSLALFRNGIALRQGVDYALAGKTITFLTGAIPQSGDLLTAYYRVSGVSTFTAFADGETPAGTMNGTNVTFTLAHAPNPASGLQLFKNGMMLNPTTDYTLSGSTITFPPAAGPTGTDRLQAFYRY